MAAPTGSSPPHASPPPAEPSGEGAAPPEPEALPKMPSAVGWWVGGILLAVGLLGGAILAGVGLGRLVDLTTGQRVTVGSSRSLSLTPGSYQVKVDGYYAINPRVFVKTPDGREIDVTAGLDDLPTSTYSTPSRTLGRFDAPTEGTYVVRAEKRTELVAPEDEPFPSTAVRPSTTVRRGSASTSTTHWPGSSNYGSSYPTSVRVTRADGEVAGQALPMLFGGMLGGLAFAVAGVIVMVVTGTRRGRALRARAPKRSPAYLNFPPPPYAPAFGGPPAYGASPPGGFPYPGPGYGSAPPPGYGPSARGYPGPSSYPGPAGYRPAPGASGPAGSWAPPGEPRPDDVAPPELSPVAPTSTGAAPAATPEPDDGPYGKPAFPDPTRHDPFE